MPWRLRIVETPDPVPSDYASSRERDAASGVSVPQFLEPEPMQLGARGSCPACLQVAVRSGHDPAPGLDRFATAIGDFKRIISIQSL